MDSNSPKDFVQISPIRRQNHSCDQCRRSKRRCMSATGAKLDNNLVTKCCNCRNLQQSCTYHFAKQRNAARKRGSTAADSRAQSYIGRSGSEAQDPALPLAGKPETITPSPSESSLLADGSVTTGSDENWDIFDPMAFYDLDLIFEGGVESWPRLIHSKPLHDWASEGTDPTQVTPTSQQLIQNENISSSHVSLSSSSTEHVDGSSSTLSRSSPVLLLSSTFTSEFGADPLAGISGSLISGLMNRNAGYNTNFLAGHHAYELALENGGPRGASGPRPDPHLSSNLRKSVV